MHKGKPIKSDLEPNNRQLKRVTWNIEIGQLKKFDELSKQVGISRSNLLRLAIAEYLQNLTEE